MIDYLRLARSQAFYETRILKFHTVEAPWEVERDINGITKPSNVQHLMLYPGSGKALVASAEQSFLQLRSEGKLPNGCYQAITPCFRDEIVDSLHKRMFMKNELIMIRDTQPCEQDVFVIMDQAKQFFESEGVPCRIVKTDEAIHSYDLVAMCGTELGSYGIRHHAGLGFWVYGTGLAEPRFSFVKDKLNSAG